MGLCWVDWLLEAVELLVVAVADYAPAAAVVAAVVAAGTVVAEDLLVALLWVEVAVVAFGQH